MKPFTSFLGRIRGVALFLSALGAFISTGLVMTAPVVAPVVGVVALASATDAHAGLSFVTSLRQTRCQAIVTAAGANAVVELRTLGKPTATSGAATLPTATGSLLATLTAGATLGTCTAGSLDFDEASFTQTNSAHVAGTPGHARVKTSGGVAIADIDICGTAPCLTFTGTVATGQNVTITNVVFNEGNIN